MTSFRLIAALALPCLLGMGMLGLLFRKQRLPVLFATALGFVLGFGLLAQWMLLLGIIGAPLEASTIGLPIAAAAAVCWGLLLYRRARRNETFFERPTLQKDPVFLFLLLYLLVCAAYIYWRALAFPEYSWDAIATAGMKAKAIYFDKSIRNVTRYDHPEYPLQVAFAQAWVSAMVGKWDGLLPKIMFPLIATSYAIVQYTFVRTYTGARWAMLSLVLLTLSPLFVHHATIGYSDLTTLCYNCSTILLLFGWFRTKDLRMLLVASFLSGFTSFVKLEGSSYLVCHFAILAVMLLISKHLSWRNRLKHLLAFGVINIPIWAVYASYKVSGWRVQVVFDDATQERFQHILKYFSENLFVTGNWSIVWILLAVSLLRIRRLVGRNHLWLLVASIFMFIGLYFLVALLTTNFVYLAGNQAHKGLARLFLHFWGLVTVAVVLLNCPDEGGTAPEISPSS